MAVAKQIVRADRAARHGEWHVRYEYIGTELQGKILGLVGFGRIGQGTAILCHLALQMPILYYYVIDYPDVEAELGAKRMSLEDLLSAADVVSVHVPLLAATRRLIGEAELRRMKPTAYFINTARGPVVDQAALVKALEEGWITGAALDVFDPEPLPPDRNGFHRLTRPFFKTHCLCCQDLPYAKCFEVWVYCRESLVKMTSIPMTGFSVPA